MTQDAGTDAIAADSPRPTVDDETLVSARPGARLWAACLTATLALAAVGYALTGRPDAIWGPPVEAVAAPQGAEPSAEQINEMVQRLAERMKQSPDDAQGWSMLVRSYMALGRLDDAEAASTRVVELRPDDAQALVDHADVLAMKNGRTLQGEPMRLIERALTIDPDNLKALALAGAAAFDQGRMDEAARLWERVAQLGPPGSPLVQQARDGVAEARRQTGAAGRSGAAATVSAASAASGAGASGSASPSAAPSLGAQLAGEIAVSPALAGRVAPEDTVFVFARSAEGGETSPRMPLAALKARGRDLPLRFALGDEHAMAPGGLASARQVIVTVRVSRTGQPTPQSGDLEGRSSPVAPGRRDLRIEIDRMLP